MVNEHHIIVYIPEEKAYGVVENMGTYASLVRYTVNGVEFVVLLENEEFEIVEDIGIGIEKEE